MYLLRRGALVLKDDTEDSLSMGGEIIARRTARLPGRRNDDPRWIPSGEESILVLVQDAGGYRWDQRQADWKDAEGNLAPLIGNIALVFGSLGDAIRTAQKKRYTVSRSGMIIKVNEEVEEDPSEIGLTTHHLFTNPEVREALIKVFGGPITLEEEERLRKEMARVRRWMPTYEISEILHRQIHKLEKVKPFQRGLGR